MLPGQPGGPWYGSVLGEFVSAQFVWELEFADFGP